VADAGHATPTGLGRRDMMARTRCRQVAPGAPSSGVGVPAGVLDEASSAGPSAAVEAEVEVAANSAPALMGGDKHVMARPLPPLRREDSIALQAQTRAGEPGDVRSDNRTGIDRKREVT